MRRRIILPILFSLLALTSTASAKSLYHAEVVIPSNSAEAEDLAKIAGLKEVLVKASGRENTLSIPEIENSYSNVGQLISEISYFEKDGERYARYGYDSQKIINILTNSKASFWDNPRPEILFWLVDETQKTIYWEQSASPLIFDLKHASDKRGIPVSVPVGDIDDVLNIEPLDLLRGFNSRIKQVSQRYQPSGIVIGKIKTDIIEWQFFPSFEDMDVISPIASEIKVGTDNLFQQIVNDVTEYYAKKYAVDLGRDETKTFRFELSGITEAKEFYQAEKILNQLNSVAKVSLNNVKNEIITFELNIYDSPEIFHKELDNYQEMKPSEKHKNSLFPLSDFNFLSKKKQPEKIELAEDNQDAEKVTPSDKVVSEQNAASAEKPQTENETKEVKAIPSIQILRYEWVKSS